MSADPAQSGRLRRGWFWAILTYYVVVLGGLSHIPGPAIAELGFDVWDKAAHFALYLPIGVSLWLLVREVPRLSRPMATLGVGLCCGTLLGALDELHQNFVPGRFCTVSDVVADVLGVCVGALSAYGIGSLVNQWRS
ncbi:MAG: VanZ family protein [Myxococcota bacterium]|nr:VanZ family protein [Myxococcota bacterium]